MALEEIVSACGSQKQNANRGVQRVLEQIKPEPSLEAKMTKLKLSDFGRIVRKQGSLEKTIMLRGIEGSRKRGRLKMRWTGSMKVAI